MMPAEPRISTCPECRAESRRPECPWSAAARNIDEAGDQVRLDIERQRQGYTTAAAKITAARQSLGSAERAYDSAKILFDVGRAESLDVLDAATELTRARSDLVQSLADARIARALVHKAAGRD